jgi:hypothetical protein
MIVTSAGQGRPEAALSDIALFEAIYSARALRRLKPDHLSRRAEHHSRLPRLRPRHFDHHQPHPYGEDVKKLLAIPADIDTYALMPIGYPEGKCGPLARRPVAEVAYADRWSNPWPGPDGIGR